MATYALRPIRYIYSDNGSAAEYEDYTQKSGTAQVDGDLMVKTNNQVDVCGADPASITALVQMAAATVIPGLVDTSQSSLPIISGIKVRACDVFEISVYHATAASAVVADADLDDIFQVGIAAATVSSVYAWVADIADTSNKRITILRRAPGFTATDVYPRVWCKFIPANIVG